MFCQATVDPWRSTIMTHLPHLSKTQATGLALWSLGMVLARSCALSAVSAFLAQGLKQKDNTVRQRLREWCYESQAKRGKKRQEVRVETCFAPLLSWVLMGSWRCDVTKIPYLIRHPATLATANGHLFNSHS